MSDQEQPPFFPSNDFETGVSIVDEDEYGEEPTRRVGVAPSFAPFGGAGAPLAFDPLVGTSASKPAAVAAAPLSPPFSCPVLPALNHPLEQSTSVWVANTSAGAVLERMEAQLEQHGEEVEFETDREQGKIRGWTMDGVEFRIFFYSKSQENGVMVEIQRRSGRSWEFGKVVQELLRAAQGKTVEHDEETPPPPASSGSTVSLAFVHTLMDVNPKLGLQTLLSMTSPRKMGAAAAQSAAQQLLADAALGMAVLKLSKTEGDALRVLHNVVSVMAHQRIPEELASTILAALQDCQVEHAQRRLVERIQQKLQQH